MHGPGIGREEQVEPRSASANGIPSAALAAYQRAETVINAADKTCHLPWQLIAAIGRVESDHGRVNGNSLDTNGLARPGIYGIAARRQARHHPISDTDAGLLDTDAKFDRAVGPMQFIPSTWSVVGVDADGDAERNPQDIDDAALATAVYLCSGNDDLSAEEGQRAAVFRYNHSQSYVDLVLSIMNAYLDGDFTSVPNGTTVGRLLRPGPDPGGGGGERRRAVAASRRPARSHQPDRQPSPTTATPRGGDAGPTPGPTAADVTAEQPAPTPRPTSAHPTYHGAAHGADACRPAADGAADRSPTTS